VPRWRSIASRVAFVCVEVQLEKEGLLVQNDNWNIDKRNVRYAYQHRTIYVEECGVFVVALSHYMLDTYLSFDLSAQDALPCQRTNREGYVYFSLSLTAFDDMHL
jgi:hypothetical protein